MIVGVSTLTLRNSTVNDNRVIANVAATDDNGASGSALEFDGVATIDNTRVDRQQHRRDEQQPATPPPSERSAPSGRDRHP